MSIPGFKGFNKNLQCMGFQYEVGKEYETEKTPVGCAENGFHFCEYPLDVFNYYPPASSHFCKVEGDGQVDKRGRDTKIAVSKIHIGLEIGIKGLVDAATRVRPAPPATGVRPAPPATRVRPAPPARKAWQWRWDMEEREDSWHRKDVQCVRVDGETIKPDTFYQLVNGQFIEAEEC